MTLLKRALFWAVAGAVVGLPLDLLHVMSGVLHYTPPTSWMPFGLQAWWAVPLFAFAGMALGLGHRHGAIRIAGIAGATPVAASSAALAGNGVLIFCYASSSVLARWPWAAAALYVALWLATVSRVHAGARRALVLHSLGTAVVGPAIEATLVALGLFAYNHPDVVGVAFWLPALYLNAGAAAHLMDRNMIAREQSTVVAPK